MKPFFAATQRFTRNKRLGWLGLVVLCLSGTNSHAADWVYSFKPGDTLWGICAEYTKEPGCWQKLGPLNQIDANRRIPPGTRIRIPAAWLKIPAATATLLYANGEVELFLPDKGQQSAKADMRLPIGSRLVTKAGSATILFADGSSILLEPHSSLELDTLSNFEQSGMVDSSVRLRRGTIKTRVIKREPRSQFRTITPSAVASVRGTEYRVQVIADTETDTETKEQTETDNKVQNDNATQRTLVGVYEGLVDVGAQQKTIPVPATFGTMTEKGKPPQAPRKLLDAPIFEAFEETHFSEINADNKQTRSARIAWAKLDGAEAYQLNVFEQKSSSAAQDKLIQDYRLTDNEALVNGLAIGCYTLSLRAVDIIGLHGLSSAAPLCIKRQLATPRLRLETPLELERTQLRLSWSAVPDAKQYRLEIAPSASFESPVRTLDSADTQLTLTEDKPVFVRVTALGEDGLTSQESETIQWAPAPEEENYWDIILSIGIVLLGFL